MRRIAGRVALAAAAVVAFRVVTVAPDAAPPPELGAFVVLLGTMLLVGPRLAVSAVFFAVGNAGLRHVGLSCCVGLEAWLGASWPALFVLNVALLAGLAWIASMLAGRTAAGVLAWLFATAALLDVMVFRLQYGADASPYQIAHAAFYVDAAVAVGQALRSLRIGRAAARLRSWTQGRASPPGAADGYRS